MKNNTAKDMANRSVSHIDSKRIKGITTIELVMTLALVGASVWLAFPSYQETIEKRKLTNSAEQIVAFVNVVQSESIKRNRKLTVSYSAQDEGGWCFGAVVGNTPCDCTIVDSEKPGFCTTGASTWLLRDSDVPADNLISSMSGDGSFTFDPVRGLFADLSDMMILDFQSEKGHFQMNLRMIATGKIKLCLPSESLRISGYKSCT